MTTDNEIWVFLSHSNKDYEKVRQVRNMLEEENLRPLMFFLHCLNDEDEIDELIKREIDCRTRFILCDSDNAKDSKWVQKEVAYIKSKDRLYETIDLSKPIEEIKKSLQQFITKTRIFVSYNREEVQLAKVFALRMRKYDFNVYMDMLYDSSQTYHQDYANETLRNLDFTSKNGVVVAFVNERVFKSQDDIPGTCRYELIKATENAKKQGLDKTNIIVFAKTKDIAEFLPSDDALAPLRKGVVVPLDNIPEEERCNKAVETVLHELMPKDSILSQAENFKKGINCEKDEEESDWLYKIYAQQTFTDVKLGNECGTFIGKMNAYSKDVTLQDFIPSEDNLIQNDNGKLTVKNLIIPEGVNHFCDDCLRYITVKNIFNLPNSIISIGGIDLGTSHGCVLADANLPEVIIPSSVKTIGIFAFGNSNIERLVLPRGIKSVYARQFKGSHIGTLRISRQEWEHPDDNSYISNFFMHVDIDNLELY